MHTSVTTLLVCLEKETSILHLNLHVVGFVHFTLLTCFGRDVLRIKQATSHSQSMVFARFTT